MSHYVINSSYKNLKRVPKKALFIWVVCVILGCCILICSLMRKEPVDSLQTIELNLDNVYLYDSYGVRGSRIKLTLVSNGTTYYVWYPQKCFSKYQKAVENDLLSGSVYVVQAKISETYPLRERILNQYRIVDLRSNSSVYYKLDDETDRIQKGQKSLWILSFALLLFWVLYTIILMLFYSVITIRKRKTG